MKDALISINLKLHNPSRIKRAIIDEAMADYSEAFQYLLDCAQKELDYFINIYKDEKNLKRNFAAKWADDKLSLKYFAIEPFKDSIKIDFEWTMVSYLRLKSGNVNAGFPVSYINKETYEAEYDNIMSQISRENKNTSFLEKKLEKLMNKAENFRPIFFCRYSAIRNYCLLYNPQKDRYYAKIYLMNAKNNNRKKMISSSDGDLIYINKNMEPFEAGKRACCFLIFPLSFGKHEEKYLKAALKDPSLLKTARLIKQKDDYFLSVNIAEARPEPVDALNFMGICRGIDNFINYSIVNSKGELVSMGFEKAPAPLPADNEIHKIINDLVRTAKQYKCQAIVEKLTDKSDKLTWEDKSHKIYLPQMDCHTYNKIIGILSNKLLREGLPKAIKVSSIRIFYTCPYCGNTVRANRFSEDMLLCTSCGRTMDIESAGSFNLAKKLISYSESSIKIYVGASGKGLRFWNDPLDFEYYPTDPGNCSEEFMHKIDEHIQKFYAGIQNESKRPGFMKKLSLIKKIEANKKNIFEMISV